MTLALSSIIHYWSARYGPLPLLGGTPSHVRSSSGVWLDRQNCLRDAVVNTPRMGWATLAGERRPVLRLEPARTNQFTYSEDFTNAAWTKNECTDVTVANPIAPDQSTSTTNRISENTNNAAHVVYRATTPTANADQAYSVWLKTGTRTWAVLRSISLASVIDNSWVDLANGVAGTVSGNHILRVIKGSDGWVRIEIVVNAGTGGGSPTFQFGPTTGDGVVSFVGDTAQYIYAWGAQWEKDIGSVSSYMKTSSATVTRATDQLYWAMFPLVPQAMAIYLRHVERGSVRGLSGERLWQISNSNNDAPRLLAQANNSGVYRLFHDNAISNVTATLAAAPAIGDVVELLFIYNADGSISIAQSINGAAVTSAGPSSTLTPGATWSGATLWLATGGTVTGMGINDFAELKIVKLGDVVASTFQGRMDELSAFELTAAVEIAA